MSGEVQGAAAPAAPGSLPEVHTYALCSPPNENLHFKPVPKWLTCTLTARAGPPSFNSSHSMTRNQFLWFSSPVILQCQRASEWKTSWNSPQPQSPDTVGFWGIQISNKLRWCWCCWPWIHTLRTVTVPLTVTQHFPGSAGRTAVLVSEFETSGHLALVKDCWSRSRGTGLSRWYRFPLLQWFSDFVVPGPLYTPKNY